MNHRLLALLWLAALPLLSHAQSPRWIWSNAAGPGTVLLRKTFHTPPLLWNARLTMAADDTAEVFLNGVLVAECRGPQQPIRSEVTVRLNQGENVLAIRGVNLSGPAGVWVQLNLGGTTNVVSDESWVASTRFESGWNTLEFNAAHWKPAHVLGTNGMPPWGDIFAITSATPTNALKTLPGFQVELLRTAHLEEGSWICLTFDSRGRLIISPQGDAHPLLRLTLGSNGVARVEPIAPAIRFAMGLLWAHDSLYANARGPQGSGLYRLRDLNGDDQFQTNEVQLLKKFEGGSEHGYHALALGPDQKIYVLNGNGTKVPAGLSRASAHRHFREDVLTLNPDEGEDSATPAPAGHVLRTDAEGADWELWMGGLRNAYDFDFNPDGELFAFDSDMEWDWGAPWYQATRIVHCVSGAEFGWRDGTRLWPDYYADSLPGAVNAGIGSPTGVKFGTNSRFPEKYRRALFALDWSYGRIFAVHLTPQGASYRGEVEVFLHGTPLNLTDVEFGPDGAMYFITGGRGTQSGLYRVSHAGDVQLKNDAARNTSFAEARALRRQLEQFHGRENSSAVAFAWPQLGSGDRFLRYAARIALEAQPVSSWQERALTETNATAGLHALLALARHGPTATQPSLLQALEKWPLQSLGEESALVKLRVIQLSLLRQGRPGSEARTRLMEELSANYPAASFPLNRELSRLLLFLNAPDAIAKTLELLERARTQGEQFHYVSQLRNVRDGWTLPQREQFFSWWLKPRETLQRPPALLRWFSDVGRSYVDGAWINKYLRDFRADAVATLNTDEKTRLAPILSRPFEPARVMPSARAFVREWTMGDLLPELERVKTGRNLARGRQALVDAQCLACHRFGNDGGTSGPELTAAASKYDVRSLLESMIEPSKVLNEQYALVNVDLADGESLTGRMVRSSDDELVLEVDPFTGARETVQRRKVSAVRPSAVSPMPSGLLNVLTLDEILDLLAYLQTGGRGN